MSNFYLEYYKLLNEVYLFLDYPQIVISIHTHQNGPDMQLYRPHISDIDDENLLINLIEQKMTQHGKIQKNIAQCGTHSIDSLLNFRSDIMPKELYSDGV